MRARNTPHLPLIRSSQAKVHMELEQIHLSIIDTILFVKRNRYFMAPQVDFPAWLW